MSSSFISDRLEHVDTTVKPASGAAAMLAGHWLWKLSVNKPDVVIGQLSDEGRLRGGEEEEAASSSSDTSRPADTVDVFCCSHGRGVL